MVANFKHFALVALTTLFLFSCFAKTEQKITSFAENRIFKVIAHRGASGYLPEHTIEAAKLAIDQGANYIEQDLVLSADGILVVLHDIHIETVTNVEDVFPNRARADGRFYAIDFTLKELKQLKVHERQDSQKSQVYPQRYRGEETFRIATFDEHIELVNKANESKQNSIGIYPEIKAPEWHLSQGQNIALALFKALNEHKLNRLDANLYVQSFDPISLQYLKHDLEIKVKLVQLLAENSWEESSADYDYLKTPEGLGFISSYAHGIGPWMPQLYNFDTRHMSSLAENAKQAGLKIHPYTFRKDALPKSYNSSDVLNIMYNVIKVDGIFTDHTDTVNQWLRSQRAIKQSAN